MTSPTPAPARGEAFRLDGMPYRLAESLKQMDPATERVVVLARFERVDTPETVAQNRANYNHKKAGLCDRADLVWFEFPDWAEAVKIQAVRAKRGAALHQDAELRARYTAWFDANAAVLIEHYREAGGCWALPDRHLLSLPVRVQPDKTEVAVLPQVDEAEAVARAILDGSFYPVEG
jgi:hypothetical protein